MRRRPLVIVAVVLAMLWTGCAVRTRQGGITERSIQDEGTPTPTPAPGIDQPSNADQRGLDDFLHGQEQNSRQRPQATPTPRPAEPRHPRERTPDPRPPEATPEPLVPEAPPTVRPVPPAAVPLQLPLTSPDANRWRTALSLATTAQKKAALGLAREGHELLRKRQYDLAERRFEKAISLDPSCGYAYLGLAERRFIQGRWAEAADLATTATLRLRGDAYFLSRAYLVAARALVNNGQTTNAYGQAQAALVADPDNRDAAALMRLLEESLGGPPQ